MNTQTHPRPSARDRELVRGAYDLHVHTVLISYQEVPPTLSLPSVVGNGGWPAS
ncbi:MAG TPA: hypothetical protein VFA10_15465 [Ktedonobacteraceae bacterium]|nr:hypothetical protein [Ktedonobacteraceae bacterium]